MEAKDWITSVGVMLAAITGVWNVWWQVKGKSDKFIVGLDSVKPTIDSDLLMHVISVCDHPVMLKDWGLIESDGRLHSIPLAFDTGEIDAVRFNGSSNLSKRNDFYETGYALNKPIIGAYAISINQLSPRIVFKYSTPIWKRTKIRLMLVWKGSNYLRD